MEIERLRNKDKILREAAAAMNCEPSALPSMIEKFQNDIEGTKKHAKSTR